MVGSNVAEHGDIGVHGFVGTNDESTLRVTALVLALVQCRRGEGVKRGGLGVSWLEGDLNWCIVDKMWCLPWTHCLHRQYWYYCCCCCCCCWWGWLQHMGLRP